MRRPSIVRTFERSRVNDRLIVRGAREHNLKDVSLDLPRDALIVFTGLSGSGKSSLAFDTIFAEGQRRYVESLSAYARQFLGQMDKPDVDFIEGLSPAVSIDQKSTSRNPRSTVGTITEVYDYLRLLWARIGRPHCPICGEPISKQTPQQIVDRILEMPEGTRFQVLAPVIRERKGEYVDLLGDLQAKGFARARVDGIVYPLTDPPKLKKQEKHTIEAVVDRLVGAAVEQAAHHRLDRDRPGPGRRRGRARLRRPRRVRPAPRAALLRAPGLPQRPPAGHRRARAALVLVQLAVRRVPGLHRPRHPQGGRPGTGRPRPRAQPGRGRGHAVVHRPDQRVLPAAAAGRRRHARLRHRRPVGVAAGARAEGRAARAVASRCTSATATATAATARTTRPTRASCRGSSGATPRPTATTRARSTRATCARCPARRARAPGSSRRSSPSPSRAARSPRCRRCRSATPRRGSPGSTSTSARR